MKNLSFRKDRIFRYNRLNKIGFSLSLVVFLAAIIVLIITYFFLRDSNIQLFITLNNIINHFSSQIGGATPLGIFYTTLFGGLFFISIPLEVLFIRFLNSGNSIIILFLFYFLGLIISFTANYYLGYKLSSLSKRLISPKKFYKTKGILNRYGAWAIFAFNATPLPSQLLSVILGVFRYNKTRFYVFFLAGQLVKYTAIALFILLF